MSEQYSKADIQVIAEGLIEELRECEDGTDITTCQLLSSSGYDLDEFDCRDFFHIHDALFKAARANHISLDMSAHKNKVEGLPYNLDFVVRNKKAQIKCPHCGSKDTARYLYGYPLFDERMQKKLESGKWVLGGCCINTVEIDGKPVNTMPKRKCNRCKKDFGRAPVLLAPKKELAEDYRGIVTSICFSVGGFFGGYTNITIRKNKTGAVVKVEHSMNDGTVLEPCQITSKKWESIVNRLYSELYLHEWKKRFVNPGVLDGTQWELNLKLTNGRKRSYYGSNDYQPYWDELLKIFREFAKL